MMWLVRLALRRPLSVAVMALLMLVLGALSFASKKPLLFEVSQGCNAHAEKTEEWDVPTGQQDRDGGSDKRDMSQNCSEWVEGKSHFIFSDYDQPRQK